MHQHLGNWHNPITNISHYITELMLQKYSWVKNPFRVWWRQVDFKVIKNEKFTFHISANLWETHLSGFGQVVQVLPFGTSYAACVHGDNSVLSTYPTAREPGFKDYYDAIWHSFENT